jgi:hypothetical protein
MSDMDTRGITPWLTSIDEKLDQILAKWNAVDPRELDSQAVLGERLRELLTLSEAVIAYIDAWRAKDEQDESAPLEDRQRLARAKARALFRMQKLVDPTFAPDVPLGCSERTPTDTERIVWLANHFAEFTAHAHTISSVVGKLDFRTVVDAAMRGDYSLQTARADSEETTT